MKICFLAPANNYHTQKWCKWFLTKGYEIVVISLTNGTIDGVQVYNLLPQIDSNNSELKKYKYLFVVNKIKRIVHKEAPDVISVHYASSYGFLAALANFPHYSLSVWGSDIFEFPRKGIIHKLVIKYSLSKANKVLSTSEYMANEVRKYVERDIYITPFGVDMTLFNPDKKRDEIKNKFVIGTVKSLKDIYGIDLLIEAVSIIAKKRPCIYNALELRIAGDGPQKNDYKLLAEQLNVSNVITWLGFLDQNAVACEWANMDLGIIYSREESFGVSAVEAQAAGTPLIISDVLGLVETTNPGFSSYIVERNNAAQLADAICYLFANKSRLKTMGKNGRAYVQDKFEINHCFDVIRSILLKDD